jgi:DNA-directed RNA polymerase subunit M/transcription elongation factor TFIIS
VIRSFLKSLLKPKRIIESKVILTNKREFKDEILNCPHCDNLLQIKSTAKFKCDNCDNEVFISISKVEEKILVLRTKEDKKKLQRWNKVMRALKNNHEDIIIEIQEKGLSFEKNPNFNLIDYTWGLLQKKNLENMKSGYDHNKFTFMFATQARLLEIEESWKRCIIFNTYTLHYFANDCMNFYGTEYYKKEKSNRLPSAYANRIIRASKKGKFDYRDYIVSNLKMNFGNDLPFKLEETLPDILAFIDSLNK